MEITRISAARKIGSQSAKDVDEGSKRFWRNATINRE